MTLKLMGKKQWDDSDLRREGQSNRLHGDLRRAECCRPNQTQRYRRVRCCTAVHVQSETQKKNFEASPGPFCKGRSRASTSTAESSCRNEEFQVGQEIGVKLVFRVTYVDIRCFKRKRLPGRYQAPPFRRRSRIPRFRIPSPWRIPGMRTSPGRCLPGQKKAGRMGGEAVTHAEFTRSPR